VTSSLKKSDAHREREEVTSTSSSEGRSHYPLKGVLTPDPSRSHGGKKESVRLRSLSSFPSSVNLPTKTDNERKTQK
jgi:hypothetical protein